MNNDVLADRPVTYIQITTLNKLSVYNINSCLKHIINAIRVLSI